MQTTDNNGACSNLVAYIVLLIIIIGHRRCAYYIFRRWVFLFFIFLSVAFPARPYIRLPQPVPISKGHRGGCYLKYDPFENSSHVGREPPKCAQNWAEKWPPGRQNSSHSNSKQFFGKLKAGLECTIFQVYCIKISCKLAPTVRISCFLFGRVFALFRLS